MGANSDMKNKKRNSVLEYFLRRFRGPEKPPSSEVENVTSSMVTVDEVMGSHLFKIEKYSVQKLNAKGRYLQSATFSVGGHDWHLVFYPNGDTRAKKGSASIYLKSNAAAGKVIAAHWTYTFLNQKGRQLWKGQQSNIYTFSKKTNTWGYSNCLGKWMFESGVGKDDCLVIKCDVTIVKESLQKCDL